MIRTVLRLVIWGIVSWLVFSNLWVIYYRFLPPPVTILQVQRLFQDGYAIKYRWQDLRNVNANLPKAVVSSEDQLFFEHNGFDWKAIQRTWNANKRGRKVAGASTISQQTAKNAFLWPSRTWVRKGLEAYFTLLIELWWPKERILAVYLNVIEMGPGIYGAEAAAEHHYGVAPAKLSRGQAAGIAAILPLPLKWDPNKPNTRVRSRIRKVQREMNALKAPQIGEIYE